MWYEQKQMILKKKVNAYNSLVHTTYDNSVFSRTAQLRRLWNDWARDTRSRLFVRFRKTFVTTSWVVQHATSAATPCERNVRRRISRLDTPAIAREVRAMELWGKLKSCHELITPLSSVRRLSTEVFIAAANTWYTLAPTTTITPVAGQQQKQLLLTYQGINAHPYLPNSSNQPLCCWLKLQ